MVYLIGVDHVRAQRRKRGEELTDCQREFQSVVESAIRSIDPCLLAEEDHPEFLSRDGADSILLGIAMAHRIKNRHRFVDPNDTERERIGYRALYGPPYEAVLTSAHEITHQFPKREEFWFGKLQDIIDRDILFVCGWAHIESFSALLTRKEVSFSVWANKIGACLSDLEFDDKVRKHIKDNPEEFNSPKCFCQGQFSIPRA
jgi:hypothetical protein